MGSETKQLAGEGRWTRQVWGCYSDLAEQPRRQSPREGTTRAGAVALPHCGLRAPSFLSCSAAGLEEKLSEVPANSNRCGSGQLTS